MLTGAYFMAEPLFNDVYQPATRRKIEEQIQIKVPLLTNDNYLDYKEHLKNMQVLFSGWGAPTFDAQFLDLVPNLEVIFYAAGTMKQILTDEVWARDIRVTTANVANSIPVAEFVLAEILFSLKNGWRLSQQVRTDKTFVNGVFQPVKGIYQTTVGLVSMSQIGRRVAELLQPFEINIISYDPYAKDKTLAELGVKMCSLEEVFANSDVVSLHTPLLPETRRMVTGDLIRSMQPGATLINTARGGIIDEPALIEVLHERPDLTALLDVTNPEPPVEDSPLYTLPNVVLTPHIAGSVGQEKARLGDFMFAEMNGYLEDGSLDYEITEESYKTMA